MANFNIGQLRRNQISSFTIDYNYTVGKILNENSIVNFYDYSLFLPGNQILSVDYSYYIKFDITQFTDSVQDFVIKLKNKEDVEGPVQEIRTFNVLQGNGKTSFELIFTPNSSYDTIVFELKRTAVDFIIINPDGTSGRKMDINIQNFSLVTNIINSYLTSHYDGLTSLKKIGIQGPPGLLFVLNGEEIRINRTGIYELYHDSILITYLGFIIKDSLFTQDGKDFFIMDFKY